MMAIFTYGFGISEENFTEKDVDLVVLSDYNHLLEQPTIFYATALTLALLGSESAAAVMLAWGYVGLRVVHSLLQALWNKIEVRFGVFALSTLVLFGLVYQAAVLLWS